jgi:Flp pilus assembly protein TadD
MTKPRRLPDFVIWLFLVLLPVFAAVSAEPSVGSEPEAKTEPAGSPAPISPEVKKAAEEGLKAFAKNDLETAGSAFRKLLSMEPENLTGLVNLGLVEYRLNHPGEAEKFLKSAVRIKPEAAFAWLALGIVCYGQEKLDAALAALAQAAVLEPKNPKVHNYMAVTIGKKGWYSGAESELQKAIELDPNYAEAHFNLAVFYLQRSPPAVELARRHYQKALELGAAPDPLVEKELETK